MSHFPITNEPTFLRLIWKKYPRCEGEQDTGYTRFMNAIDRAQAADRRVESTYSLTRSSPETTTNGGFEERKKNRWDDNVNILRIQKHAHALVMCKMIVVLASDRGEVRVGCVCAKHSKIRFIYSGLVGMVAAPGAQKMIDLVERKKTQP